MSDDTTGDADRSGDPTGAERRALAVSAYVDGEATPDEMRLVESDAALLADAQRIRALKYGVGDVAALGSEHRDRLLVGALGEFDDRHRRAGHTMRESPQNDAVAPPLSRSSAGRWLAVAAAAVAVVATAGLAASLVTSESDEASTDAVQEAGDATAPQAGGGQISLTEPGATDGVSATAARDEQGSDDVIPGGAGTLAEAATASTTLAGSTATDLATSPATTRATTGDTAGDSSAAGDPEELADGPAMADWVRRVRAGDLTPDGRGDSVCGRMVLGTATHRDSDVVVAIEDDRVVARDVRSCRRVLATDAP